MEEAVRDVVDQILPVIDAIGALIIVVGVGVTFVLWLGNELRVRATRYEEQRLRLGRYLALALEVQLGADILSTAISPTYDDIGKLAAIAAIRTALNFFLAREIAEEQQKVGDGARGHAVA